MFSSQVSAKSEVDMENMKNANNLVFLCSNQNWLQRQADGNLETELKCFSTAGFS